MLHISNSEGFLLEVSFSTDQFPKHVHLRSTQQRYRPKYIENAFLGYPEYFYEMSRMYSRPRFYAYVESLYCI